MAYEAPKDYVDVAERITEFRAKYPEGSLRPLDPVEPFRLVKAGGWTKNGDRIEQTFVVVVAAAYRAPDDRCPGVGMAWEVFPGRTPYTLGSELMNAETSAWGRAIIAVGAADAKRGIASAEEVRNRQAERDAPQGPATFNPVAASQGQSGWGHQDADANRGSQWHPPASPSTRKADRARGPLPDDQWTTAPPDGQGPESRPGTSTADQHRKIAIRLGERGLTDRADRLAFCAEFTGRPVTSAKDLSYTEAEQILKATTG